MIPLIVVSAKLEKQEEYITKFIKENKISPYYVYKLYPPKSEITIDQIRSIKREIINTTKEKRLFVCYSFDSANLEAQNAFLKTLEEKNIDNQFILLVKNAERVIPTVRSRSQIVTLDSNSEEKFLPNEMQLLFEKIESSSDFGFLSDIKLQNITKENAELLFDEFIFYLRNSLRLGNLQSVLVLKKTFQTKNLLLNNNLNPQMAVDSVFIYFKKTSSKAS